MKAKQNACYHIIRKSEKPAFSEKECYTISVMKSLEN